MKIRADWTEYQHKHKKREIDLIFSRCPERLFSSALELGAGDGFQATLLARFALKLVSTELDPAILKNTGTDSIEYKVCNARDVSEVFNKGEFDLVFSSNLLEHIADLNRTLKGIREVLKDGGITIHIMPNPFWKFCHVLFYLPNRFFIAIERISKKERLVSMSENGAGSERRDIRRRPLIHRMFTLKPHGAYKSNIEEFSALTRSRWIKEFEGADLELISIIKGPLHSGYGFGLDILRNILEKFGFSSESIYIAVKKGQYSHYRDYFERHKG
jgi:SAM-dependent methyltransferase